MKRQPIVLTKTGEAVYLFGISLGLTLLSFGVIRLFAHLVVWVASF